METFEAIRTRRSIGRVKPDPVDDDLVKRMLDAAVWAPNHHLTEPWRFFVMTGDGRTKLGEALARIALAKEADPASAESAAKADSARGKALRAPVVIGAAVTPADRKGVIELEEYGAVFAGVQNMLLAAHALGLGAVWRTGEPCFDPLMNEVFGLRPQDKMLGFVYAGRPDMDAPTGKRTDAASKTEWIRA